LFVLAQGRYEVGRIAETELLQIELRVKRADARIAAATVDLQRTTEALRDFIGIDRQVFFDLRTPEQLPQFIVNLDNALEFAFRNRTEATSFLRRVEEAKRELDRAERSAGFNMNINANFGLSNTGPQLDDVYANLLDQERLAVSFQMPLADWGKAGSRREIARSNLELVQRNVDLDRVSFERQITLRVQQFELIRNQVALAKRAYEVAQKTFTITQQRYYIGKIGIVDLNLANNEQENARQSYVNALANFWSAYYELRLLTLYDFVNDRPLIKNPE
jgi:outer membrane protein TolC